MKTPIAEGSLAAVGTGATASADTLARRGLILYYKLCISHSRDSWDVNSRKSIGNSMVDSSTRDRECLQQKERKNCLSTSSRRDVKNSDSLKCLIYKYYSKRWDDSNLRIISNSRNLSNSRHANNSRDVNIRKNIINVGNTNIRRTLTAVGAAATAETLATEGTPGMSTAVRTLATAWSTAAKSNSSTDFRYFSNKRNTSNSRIPGTPEKQHQQKCQQQLGW